MQLYNYTIIHSFNLDLMPQKMKTKSTNIALEKGTHGSDVMGRFCGRGTPLQALCFFWKGAYMGMIYKRGKTYWIKYYRNGKPFYESSESQKESDELAESLGSFGSDT